MAIRTANAEGYVDGAAVTLANTGSGSAIDGLVLHAGTITASATTPIKGLLSYNFNIDPIDTTYMFWTPTASHNVALRAYFRFAGYPAAATQFVRFSTATGGTPHATVGMTPDGRVIFQNSTTVTVYNGTNAGILQLGSDYRMEVLLNNGTNTTDSATMNWYAGDSDTPITGASVTIDGTGAFGTANIGRISIGKYSNGGAWPGFRVDDVALADNQTTMFGPSVDAVVLPSAQFDKTHYVDVNASASVGTVTLVQTGGPTVTITSTGTSQWRIDLAETRTENVVLTLTATQGGATDTETITIPANGLIGGNGTGPKIFMNGEYI